MRKLQSLMIGLSLIWACNNAETITNELPSGMKEVYQVDENGSKNGAYKLYYTDGVLFEESNYYEGKLKGLRKLYYPSGKKEIEEQYKNDTIIGTYKMFHQNGQLKLVGDYEKGVMKGIWKSYYENGILKEEVSFKENLENGPFTEYYETGKIKAKGQYAAGENEQGTLFLYDSTGQVERVMDCDTGICRTKWTPDSTFAMPTE